jgi:hypothetical protein
LKNEEEREKFAVNAMELVKQECRFTPILKKAMKGLI